jgi:hypothetical protein
LVINKNERECISICYYHARCTRNSSDLKREERGKERGTEEGERGRYDNIIWYSPAYQKSCCSCNP